MFEFSVSKDMNFFNNDERRIPTHLQTYLLTLISVDQGRVVTTFNIITH